MQHHEISSQCRAVNISVKELAKRIGTSRQYLHMIQNGARPAPEEWMRKIEAAIAKAATIKKMTDAALNEA